MFGLPSLPIPEPTPNQPTSAMDAISTSQSWRDESHHSPSNPTVPTTHHHSPEPEPAPEEGKCPNIWDLKDPAHPLHHHRVQQAYKEWLDRDWAKADTEQAPSSGSSNCSLSSPHLGVIPEEDEPETTLPHGPPIARPSTILGGLSPISDS
jgi:hypothetical protein